MKAADGDRYALCEYHADAVWTTTVARWHGETGLRASAPVVLQAAAREPAFIW
jgi:hypothetical protein